MVGSVVQMVVASLHTDIAPVQMVVASLHTDIAPVQMVVVAIVDDSITGADVCCFHCR